MNQKAHQIISGMTDGEWTILLLRLGRYALRTCRNLSWRTQSSQELPAGETVGSIVSKAFQKLFCGERNWNPDTDPSLEKYLMDVIDSLVNHLAESDENTRLAIIPEQESGRNTLDVQAARAEAAAAWLSTPCHTPEEILRGKEQESQNEEALLALIAECDSSPVLKRVLEAMFDGYDTPRSIADRCGLTSAEVYNANKQLDRKIARVKRQMGLDAAAPVTKGKKNV